MPYSDKVTRQRVIIHDLMSAKKMPKHWSMLEEAAKFVQLVANLGLWQHIEVDFIGHYFVISIPTQTICKRILGMHWALLLWR